MFPPLHHCRAAAALAWLALIAAPVAAAIGGADSPAGLVETIAPEAGAIAVSPVATTLPITVAYSGADDADNALLRVELWYRSDAGSWQPTGLSATADAGEFAFAPAGNAPGVYHLALVAVDAVGNESAVPSGNGIATVTFEPAVAAVGDWWMLQ